MKRDTAMSIWEREAVFFDVMLSLEPNPGDRVAQQVALIVEYMYLWASRV